MPKWSARQYIGWPRSNTSGTHWFFTQFLARNGRGVVWSCWYLFVFAAWPKKTSSRKRILEMYNQSSIIDPTSINIMEAWRDIKRQDITTNASANLSCRTKQLNVKYVFTITLPCTALNVFTPGDVMAVADVGAHDQPHLPQQVEMDSSRLVACFDLFMPLGGRPCNQIYDIAKIRSGAKNENKQKLYQKWTLVLWT